MTVPVHLLGPQRPDPNLADALRVAGVSGDLALVTAGWRLDEGEIAPLVSHVGRPVRHLELYAWFEELMAAHPALKKDYRARQERIRAYKELYRARLAPTLRAVDAVESVAADLSTPPDLALAARDDAQEAVRVLDRQVMNAVTAIRAEYPHLERPWELDEVAPYVARIQEVLAGCGALAIAGGHVGVLRNRMHLMGFDDWLPDYRARGGALVAWAGGSMVLTQRVVLFYDDPPFGSGEAEVFSPGFGAVRGLLLFPHARRRLRLGDSQRLGRLARRFAPDRCLGMENGAWLEVGAALVDRSRPDTCFDLTALPPGLEASP